VLVLYVGSDFASLDPCTGEDLSFRVCETGREAQQALHREAFEIVVLSADLTDVSFQELIALIKEVDDKTCIILQVEPDDMVNVEKALLLGADHYLIKGRGNAELLLHLHKTKRRMTRPVYYGTHHTRNQRTKEELRESQESYRQLVELSPNAILACLDGRIILANRRAARLFGATGPESLAGKAIWDFIHPHDQLTLKVRVHQVLTNKITMPFVEGRVINRRKEVLDTEIAAAPFTHHGQAAVQFVIHDMTEHRQMQEALQDSNQKLNAVINASPLAIKCLDKGGNVTQWNKAAELLTGWGAEEVMGSFTPLILDYNLHHFWDMRKRLNRNEPVSGLETRIKRKDGRSIEVEIFVAPLYDKKGHMNGTLTILQDITERKRLEDQLQMASKMETIGILAGGIAHDYNNILTVMAGNISLAQIYLGSNVDKVSEKIKEIERAVLQAKELTRQLATFSKGGAPAKEILPLKRFLRNTVSLSLRGSSVKENFSLAGNLHLVQMDEGQIRQALNNIIINAVQAMPQGGRIWVEAENYNFEENPDRHVSLDKGDYVKITIRDQGPGIPESDIKKIFDPLYSTKPQGSGLGLTTAFSIVQRHGGTITVESRAGVGTAFNIYLPASAKKRARKETRAKDLVKGRGKILIMDDEEPIRKVVAEMLAYLGYETRAAMDGAEALQMYKKAMEEGSSFDAVIMDLTVPGGMGGQEAMEKLRLLDPEVKAIVSSGYSDGPVMSNYREHGFQGITLKPYKAEELSRALEKVLKRKRVSSADLNC
jgi:PAS domain S-box-containing protein